MKPITVLFFILGPVHTFAQTPNSRNEDSTAVLFPTSTSIGIKSGLALSGMLIKNFGGDEPELPLLNFTGGLSLHRQVLPSWFFAADLLYERKGYKREIYRGGPRGEIAGPYDFELIFNYISLPLSLNFQTAGKNRVYAGTGVYTAYILNAYSFEPWFDFSQWQTPAHEWEVLGYARTNQKSNFHDIDIGIAGQAGFIFPLAENLIVNIEFRVTSGIKSIARDEDVKYYNRTFNSAIGVKYVLQK